MGIHELPIWLENFKNEISPTTAAELMFEMFGKVGFDEKGFPGRLPEITQELSRDKILVSSDNGKPKYIADECLRGGYCWQLNLKSSDRESISSINTKWAPVIHAENVNGASEIISVTYGDHRFLMKDYPAKDIVFTFCREGGETSSFGAYSFFKDQFGEVNFGRFPELINWVEVQDLIAIASVEMASGTLIEMWKSVGKLGFYELQAGFYNKISMTEILRKLYRII